MLNSLGRDNTATENDRDTSNNRMESNRRRGHAFLQEDDVNKDTTSSVSTNNDGPAAYDPNATFEEEDSDNQDLDTLTAENEEEYFSRGRSRSRSVHEQDENKVKVLSEKEIQDQVAKAREHSNDRNRDKIEKSGPLAHREVAVLQQGLQQATTQKREEERLEEQAELEAALREKEQRTLSSSGYNSNIGVQIGADPPMRRVKILLLGDSNVGKTSIISRLTSGDFKTRMVQTVGVDYKVKKLNVDGENIQVQLWDTAGSERFHQITTSYYRGVNGIMLCFDVSNRDTYDRVSTWMHSIKKHASENVHILLVGNKIDLRVGDDPSCVYAKEVKPHASKYHIPYAELSALTADNVEGALLELVRSIIQGDDTVSTLRKSVDSAMKRGESKSGTSPPGSGERSKDKEKCVVC